MLAAANAILLPGTQVAVPVPGVDRLITIGVELAARNLHITELEGEVASRDNPSLQA